jgi:hypothetical protein
MATDRRALLEKWRLQELEVGVICIIIIGVV